jgi:hypothetical protein
MHHAVQHFMPGVALVMILLLPVLIVFKIRARRRWRKTGRHEMGLRGFYFLATMTISLSCLQWVYRRYLSPAPHYSDWHALIRVIVIGVPLCVVLLLRIWQGVRRRARAREDDLSASYDVRNRFRAGEE